MFPFDEGFLLEVDGSVTVIFGNGAGDCELLESWGFDEGEIRRFKLEVVRVTGARWERNLGGM